MDEKKAISGEIDQYEFKRLFHAGKIRFAGNRKLKIYGKLDCSSGKRMLKRNRVFFSSEAEALSLGFRPCGHCMRKLRTSPLQGI